MHDWIMIIQMHFPIKDILSSRTLYYHHDPVIEQHRIAHNNRTHSKILW